ncbi:MAG: chemotaxis family two-component system response regulator Rcp1 [Limisphaerales bacterium]|jgi:chemotaxis family two-component system response regulator Rcp1
MQSTSNKVFKILLIEDNDGDIFLLKKSIETGGFSVDLDICKTGEAALSHLNTAESASYPDLVLLDLDLPGISGDQVLGNIKKSADLSDIPVVMLTSSEAPDDIKKAYQLHANGFVTKPIKFSDYEYLLNRIQHYWFEVVQLPKRNR